MVHRTISQIALVLLLLVLPLVCLSADMSQNFQEYLSNLKAKGTPVFYASCSSGGTKTVLLFPVGESNGVLAELDHEKVVNLNLIGFSNGKPVLGDMQGGSQNPRRTHTLSKRMPRLEYRLVAADSLAKAIKSKPGKTCK